MNPRLTELQPYPFEKLRALVKGVTPNPDLKPILLSIGEPKHATPEFILEAVERNLSGLSRYPLTLGSESLRHAIARWLERRYDLPALDPNSQIVPVLGSREALFALAQVVIDASKSKPWVICPNPFYQIYEGAAILAGAKPFFVNNTPENGFRFDTSDVSDEVWANTQLVFTCSPGNPTGKVMELDEWEKLFALSKKHGFVIASDECYSEIYLDNARPPLGAMEAAQQLGYQGYPRLISLSSLSKRSNVPGMRSGFAAGDASILKQFALYRTYHGSAMSPTVQAASEAAWQDEAHVIENRRLYREKFAAFHAIVNPVLPLTLPEAAFYFWIRTPIADTEFTQRLLQQENVAVLPGSFLAREAHGINPGTNFVRVALVSALSECIEAANRIKRFMLSL